MPTTFSTPTCSILLLAGGRGLRVGGQDKGLLPWHGEPLIAHLQRVARPFTDDLIISCNRNADQYARYADRLVCDPQEGFPGPLAGLRAGLAVARHERLLVLPCDVPGVDSSMIAAMLDASAQHPRRPLMIRQGQHWEPLLCVIPLALKAAFDMDWQAGERSPRNVMLKLEAQALPCAEGDPRLRNLNTLELLDP